MFFPPFIVGQFGCLAVGLLGCWAVGLLVNMGCKDKANFSLPAIFLPVLLLRRSVKKVTPNEV